MLSVMCNELVTDATPPVVNAGPNAGLMAIPYVCVSVPRSTKRYSSFADQPPPSLVSTPAPTVQPVRVAEKLAALGRNGPGCSAPGKITGLAKPLNASLSFTVPQAKPPVTYHKDSLTSVPARARAVPRLVSFSWVVEHQPRPFAPAPKNAILAGGVQLVAVAFCEVHCQSASMPKT